MKIVTILGARPQFIKAAPVSKALRARGIDERLIHTGQHYDYGMSQVFFDEMGIPTPDINLGVGSGTHGRQTGQMLAGIEEVLLNEKPDGMLVYGDTNSTLAGALAAVKLHIPVAHVEAGLRSFNRAMPEEHNRVLTDHCSDILFCPTKTAVANLHTEGIQQNIHIVGDTMYDAVLQFTEIARQKATILTDLSLKPQGYLLATIHRPYNTDSPENLRQILNAFQTVSEKVVFPVHPRTRKKIIELYGEDSINALSNNLKIINPVGYLDMLLLEQNARMILTDSGGVQKEAFFFEVPCITLRPETEWVETVESGWNILTQAKKDAIVQAVTTFSIPAVRENYYGDGTASNRIVEIIDRFITPRLL